MHRGSGRGRPDAGSLDGAEPRRPQRGMTEWAEVTQTAAAWRDDRPVVVIGAGPAGLTAAYQLSKAGRAAIVLEADDVVGGISRTVERDGWRFDIGGHRFFTKVQPVEDLWHEILPADDFLLRPRMSRIYYEGKFYDYPIKPCSTPLRNLGLVEAVRCGLSYPEGAGAAARGPEHARGLHRRQLRAGGSTSTSSRPTAKRCGACRRRRSRPTGAPSASRACRCSRRCGSPCGRAWRAARRNRAQQVTSLIEEFQYPKLGPGMMWETCRDLVEKAGVEVLLQSPVVQRRARAGRVPLAVVFEHGGDAERVETDHVISSMPFSALVRGHGPAAAPRGAGRRRRRCTTATS